MHRLGCQPFYCFGEDDFFFFFFFFSHSSSLLPSCSSLIRPCPSSLSWLSVTRVLGNTRRERARKRARERERERSLSLKSPVCLLSLLYCCYLPSCLAFSFQQTFCFAVSRRHFSFCLALFKLPFLVLPLSPSDSAVKSVFACV